MKMLAIESLVTENWEHGRVPRSHQSRNLVTKIESK
jgi:hypothetical protein